MNTTQTIPKGWQRLNRLLYKPLFSRVRKEDRSGELPEGERVLKVNQEFFNDFLKDAREGKRWCEEASMHWAEMLTFPFSKMIITFDLGILAFIGVMKDSFADPRVLILSVACAIASLLILSIFTRRVIVKNINLKISIILENRVKALF